MRTIVRIAALLCALSGLAGAQTQVLCNQGSSRVPCTAPLLNTYPNWASPGTIGSGTATTIRGTTITATTQFTGSGAGLTSVPAASVVGAFSGVTVDCASNTCQNIANAALLTGIDALKLGGGLVSNTEYGYLDGVTSPIQTQIDGLGVLVNLLVNDGYTLFLHRTASDIATYETLRSEPANGLEKIDSVAVTSGTSPQLLDAYATDPGVPGVGTLPSGMWGFREFASVDNTGGTSTILVRVYKRDTLGAETLLFETTSPTITTTSATLYYWIYTQSVDFTLNNTDRIVIRYYGQTTSAASRTISHYYEGSTHASWLSTPMPAPLPVSGAQAQIVATPPTATGQVALRTLTTDYFPTSGVAAASYPTAGLIPTFTVDAYGRLTTAGSAASLSGVAIDCASNTCSNVSLTAAVTGVLPIANGGTNSNTALSNNRAVISSGGKLIETASACGTGTILNGGSPPNCTSTPTVGTSLTVPRIDSAGSLIINGATGGNVQLSVNSTTAFTAAAGLLTAAQRLEMSGQKITGLAPATASGDALSYPWVTSNVSTAVATTTSLADTSGTYTDVTGATLSLAAGTHIVATTLRAEIGATTGAGAFITCRLHDGTNPITNTETLITQDNQLLVLAQNTTTLIWPVTVGSTTSVKAQCTRVFSGTLFTSDIPSDSNGRTRMFSVQTAP